MVTGKTVHRETYVTSGFQSVTSAEKYEAINTFQLFHIVYRLEQKLLHRSRVLQAPSQLMRNGKVL